METFTHLDDSFLWLIRCLCVDYILTVQYFQNTIFTDIKILKCADDKAEAKLRHMMVLCIHTCTCTCVTMHKCDNTPQIDWQTNRLHNSIPRLHMYMYRGISIRHATVTVFPRRLHGGGRCSIIVLHTHSLVSSSGTHTFLCQPLEAITWQVWSRYSWNTHTHTDRQTERQT